MTPKPREGLDQQLWFGLQLDVSLQAFDNFKCQPVKKPCGKQVLVQLCLKGAFTCPCGHEAVRENCSWALIGFISRKTDLSVAKEQLLFCCFFLCLSDSLSTSILCLLVGTREGKAEWTFPTLLAQTVPICWRSPQHWADGIISGRRGVQEYVTALLYDCRHDLQLSSCVLFTRKFTKGLIFRILERHEKKLINKGISRSSLIKVSAPLTCSSWAGSQHIISSLGALETDSPLLRSVHGNRLMPYFCPDISVQVYEKIISWSSNCLKGLELVVFLLVGVSFVLLLARGLPWENMNMIWALLLPHCSQPGTPVSLAVGFNAGGKSQSMESSFPLGKWNFLPVSVVQCGCSACFPFQHPQHGMSISVSSCFSECSCWSGL